MKTYYKVTLAVLAGASIGAVVMDRLHAQGKPPVYVVSEIDISNSDGYMNEFVPKFRAALKATSGRIMAASTKVTLIEGEAPKGRVVIQQWDGVEQYQAFRNSADGKAAREIGNKYAKFRIFAVEGVTQ